MSERAARPPAFSQSAKGRSPAIAVNPVWLQVKITSGRRLRTASQIPVTAYKRADMTRFLLVALGGALGSMARYAVGQAAVKMAPGVAWPWGTLAVNVVGGLLMGLLTGWLALRGGAGQETVRVFAAVGVLGGFTTFSAFSLEAALMIERGRLGTAAAYVGISVAASIAALFLGLMLARRVLA